MKSLREWTDDTIHKEQMLVFSGAQMKGFKGGGCVYLRGGIFIAQHGRGDPCPATDASGRQACVQ